MTNAISPIRILVLHSDQRMRECLALALHYSLRLLKFELDVFDGNNLDHETTLSLLKKNYDYIFLNLRLPWCLSIRIAQLAHLAKVQTRIVLVSGCSVKAELLTPLFDVIIPLPCLPEDLESAIWSASSLSSLARASLSTEEHVEAAIKALLTVWSSSGFEDYRTYFPQPAASVIQDISASASLAQRLSRDGIRTRRFQRSPRQGRAAHLAEPILEHNPQAPSYGPIREGERTNPGFPNGQTESNREVAGLSGGGRRSLG
jgi:hypothetical protein